MNYVSYLRVSTAKQGISGLGLEAQREAVANYMRTINGSVSSEYVEVCSGKNNDRKKLQEAMRECRLTGSTLVIAKLDRLSRNSRFLMELQESKLKFVCCDMPEANELTIGIMAVMAQHETKMISTRTKAALQAAKARGVVLGNRTNLDSVRFTDTTRARAMHIESSKARNNDMRGVLEGLKARHADSSLRELASMLNEAGYLTARGKTFTATQVSRILATPTA
jgi:DNA invertase Pin-like site-specific DNA recombinase